MEIKELQWDDNNVEHIARHDISPTEVEDVCFGLNINFAARNKRQVLYGKTENGRHIMVVIERLGSGVFRPTTAREMKEKEKRNYRRQIK